MMYIVVQTEVYNSPWKFPHVCDIYVNYSLEKDSVNPFQIWRSELTYFVCKYFSSQRRSHRIFKSLKAVLMQTSKFSTLLFLV